MKMTKPAENHGFVTRAKENLLSGAGSGIYNLGMNLTKAETTIRADQMAKAQPSILFVSPLLSGGFVGIIILSLFCSMQVKTKCHFHGISSTSAPYAE